MDNHTISRLQIIPMAYAERFRSPEYKTDKTTDEEQPFFTEWERLSYSEKEEMELWPDTISELFEMYSNKKDKMAFLSCIQGKRKPSTSIDRIVAKLIHQALAMGGLYAAFNGVVVAPNSEAGELPANDIGSLKMERLKAVLLEIQWGIYKTVSKRIRPSPQEVAQKTSLDDEYEHNEAIRESHEATEDIFEELSHQSESFAASNEEGWFYPDDDDS